MLKLSNILAALVVTLGLGAVLMTPMTASALDPVDKAREGVKATGGDSARSLGDSIKIVTNVLLFIIGAISVIMIILGGLNYVLSNGDQTKVTSAKNTILYAVIGLVVALLAFAIVNFVLDAFV